jgi:alpha-tubulin suppressor-like RCC1 family protein
MVPPAGNGDFSYAISWPAAELSNPTLDCSLTNLSTGGSEVLTETLDAAAGTATISVAGIPNGSYLFSVVLQEGTTPVWGIVDGIIVYKDYSSDGTVALTATQIKTAPEAVIDLVASKVTIREVTLSWRDVSQTEEGFIVERSDDGGLSWSPLTVDPLRRNTTAFTDDTVSEGGSYQYRVLATNAWGQRASDVMLVDVPTTIFKSGTLSEDETWASGGFYQVSGTLDVAAGVVLTVEPGVTVSFEADAGMEVNGTLVAQGTSESVITFTSSSLSPSRGAWDMLDFRGDAADAVLAGDGSYLSGSVLEHVLFEYGTGVLVRDTFPYLSHVELREMAGFDDTTAVPYKYGALAFGFSSSSSDSAKALVAEHLTIQSSAEYAGVAVHSVAGAAGEVVIRSSTMSNSQGVGRAIYASVKSTSFGLRIEDNTVTGFGYGVDVPWWDNWSATYVPGNEAIRVLRNEFTGMQWWAISIQQQPLGVSIEDNRISNTRSGISVSQTPVVITGNVLVQNGLDSSSNNGTALHVSYPRSTTITQNEIVDNGGTSAICFEGTTYNGTGSLAGLTNNLIYNPTATYEIELRGWDGDSQQDLVATDNYWGETDLLAGDLDDRILDATNGGTHLGQVLWDPAKNVNGILIQKNAPVDAATLTTSATELSWTTFGPAESYAVQVATADTFGSGELVIDVTTLSDPFSLNDAPGVGDLTHGSTYYWRVAGIDATGVRYDFSDLTQGAFSFTLDLSSPRPLSPADGATWYEDVQLTLDWEDVAESAVYVFQLADEATFAAPLVADTVAASTYIVTDDLSLDSDYYWRVAIRDANGVQGPWSSVRQVFVPSPGAGVEIINGIPDSTVLSISGLADPQLVIGDDFSLSLGAAKTVRRASWYLDGSFIAQAEGGSITFGTSTSSSYTTVGAGPGIYVLGATATFTDGTESTATTMFEIIPLKAEAIFAASYSSFAMRNNSQAYGWGNGSSGKLGNGGWENQLNPVEESLVPTVIDIDAGWNWTVALDTGGDVYAWGHNNAGLGDAAATTSSEQSPVIVDGISNAAAVDVANESAFVLDSGGTLYAWGGNGSGQLGVGGFVDQSTPSAITFPSPVASFSAEESLVAAIADSDGDGDGDVYYWGTQNAFDTPQIAQQPADTDFIAVAAENHRFHALTAGGTVYTWFPNDPASQPYLMQITDVAALTAGSNHALALKSDGTVWAWGDNWSGQLGDGTRQYRSLPIQVEGLEQVVAIDAGSQHSLALVNDGSIWGWGENNEGQLGIGSTGSAYTPQQVIFTDDES